MRGAGYYSERTAGARDVINNAGPMIQAAIEEIPKDKILRIADFGAADGGTSNQMWDNVISKRRKAGDFRQIEMLYTDLPSNDFSSLFRMMQGMQGNSNFALQKPRQCVRAWMWYRVPSTASL